MTLTHSYKPLIGLVIFLIAVLFAVVQFLPATKGNTAQAEPWKLGSPEYLEQLVVQRGRYVRNEAKHQIQSSIYIYVDRLGKLVPFPNGTWKGGTVDKGRCCSIKPSNGAVRASTTVTVHWKSTPFTNFGPCWDQSINFWHLPYAHQGKLIDCYRTVYAWLDPHNGTARYQSMPWVFPLEMG